MRGIYGEKRDICNGQAMDLTPSTPAARLIAEFGVDNLARWAKRDRTRVYAWTWAPSKGGTGGAVPLGARRGIILGVFADHGRALTHAEFEPRPGETYLTDDAPDNRPEGQG